MPIAYTAFLTASTALFEVIIMLIVTGIIILKDYLDMEKMVKESEIIFPPKPKLPPIPKEKIRDDVNE